MAKQLPVLAEEKGWQSKGSFRRDDPWCIYYCYPTEGGPFVIKGGSEFCRVALGNKEFKGFYYTSFWQKGTSRGFYRVMGLKRVMHTEYPIGSGPTTSTLSALTRKERRKWYRDNKAHYFYFEGKLILKTRRWPGSFPKQLKKYVV